MGLRASSILNCGKLFNIKAKALKMCRLKVKARNRGVNEKVG